MHFKRTDQTLGIRLSEFDVLRGNAEARLLTGSGFPDKYFSILRVRTAGLTKNGESLASASDRIALAFREASSRMRRLFGPRGNAARQCVLSAADSDAVSKGEDFAAWVAYRKAQNEKRREKGYEGHSNTGGVKRKEEGRTLNGLNRRTGGRNRCYASKCEYHCAPRRSRKENRSSGLSSLHRAAKRPPSPPYSSIATEFPSHVQPPTWDGEMGSGRTYEHSLSTALDIGGQFVSVQGTVLSYWTRVRRPICPDSGGPIIIRRTCRKWVPRMRIQILR